MIHRSTWAEVSRESVKRNISIATEGLAPGTKVCGVVKADAYGHGLKGFVKMLTKDRMVDCVAVGKISELRKLMEIVIPREINILLLGNATADEIESDISNKLIDPNRAIFSVYSYEQLKRINQAAINCGIILKVHIRMDVWNSGMGFGPEEFLTRQDELFSLFNLRIMGLYTHLYTSYSENDVLIRDELDKFKAVVDRIEPEYRKLLTVHVLNSSLVFKFSEYAFDMVRLGTAMYGLPCGDGGKLIPAMKVCAIVFDVRDIPCSVPLSYHSEKECVINRRIARIMFGYWDSPLLLTQQNVLININGKLFKPADEVCMDNLCIDVTGDDTVKVGDTAVLMGAEGVEIQDILDRNHINYVHSEWMCMTATRLEKVYV